MDLIFKQVHRRSIKAELRSFECNLASLGDDGLHRNPLTLSALFKMAKRPGCLVHCSHLRGGKFGLQKVQEKFEASKWASVVLCWP
jgi:hypothetical protein